jgi:thioredoxin 1
MKRYFIMPMLFLSSIGLTSCLSREKTAAEPTTDTTIAPQILEQNLAEKSSTRNPHNEAGKVRYFSEFVKRHDSVDEAFAAVTTYPNVIIDFYADWCGPCQSLGTILSSIAPTYNNILIVKVNIDEFQGLADRFNVRSIPTVLFFKNGSLVQQLKGFDKKRLMETIKTIF